MKHPIGSSLSGTLANFYLDPIITKISAFLDDLKGDYVRYVDDFLFLIPCETDTKLFLERLNKLDEHIVFECEKEGNRIDYLNMEISYSSESVDFKWYRKPTSGMRYLHYKSNVPTATKRATVIGTFKHIKNCNILSDTKKYFEEDIRTLEKILEHNQYPINLVKKWLNDERKKHHEVVELSNETSVKGQRESGKPNSEKNISISFDDWRIMNNKYIGSVAKDGHCFLHCLQELLDLRLEKIKSLLKISITQKQDKLKSFCTSDLSSLMEKYFEDKNWNSDFGDIIPVIAAEAFNISLVILKNVEGKLNQVNINEEGKKVLGLVLENQHYSYIRKEEDTKNIIERLKNQNGIDSNISEIDENSYKKESEIPRKVDYTQQAKLILKYSSEKSTKKIKQAIKNLDKNNEIQVIFKSSVRFLDLIKHQSTEGANNGYNFEQIEKKKGAIYQATCVKCQKEKRNTLYIGESGRKLEERIKEHMRQVKVIEDPTKNSAIALHAIRVHNSQPSREDWDFKILDSTQNTFNRKLLEAHYIKKINPNLNRENSVSVISSTRRGFK